MNAGNSFMHIWTTFVTLVSASLSEESIMTTVSPIVGLETSAVFTVSFINVVRITKKVNYIKND